MDASWLWRRDINQRKKWRRARVVCVFNLSKNLRAKGAAWLLVFFLLTNSSQGNNLAFLPLIVSFYYRGHRHSLLLPFPFSILFIFAHFWSFFSPPRNLMFCLSFLLSFPFAPVNLSLTLLSLFNSKKYNLFALAAKPFIYLSYCTAQLTLRNWNVDRWTMDNSSHQALHFTLSFFLPSFLRSSSPILF